VVNIFSLRLKTNVEGDLVTATSGSSWTAAYDFTTEENMRASLEVTMNTIIDKISYWNLEYSKITYEFNSV
jgi:hypothetical protein